MCYAARTSFACGHGYHHIIARCTTHLSSSPCCIIHPSHVLSATFLQDTCAPCHPPIRAAQVRAVYDKLRAKEVEKLREAYSANMVDTGLVREIEARMRVLDGQCLMDVQRAQNGGVKGGVHFGDEKVKWPGMDEDDEFLMARWGEEQKNGTRDLMRLILERKIREIEKTRERKSKGKQSKY